MVAKSSARQHGARLTKQQSKTAVSDLAFVSHIKAALREICEAEVSSSDGHVHIKVEAQKIRKIGQASPALQMHIFSTI